MEFAYSITLPTDGTKATATVKSMPVSFGVVTNVQIVFPAGCWGLVHVKIFDDGHQLWPLNPEGEYAANNETINIEESYEIKALPAKFRFWGYNEDQIYTHTIDVRITVLPKTVAYPYLAFKTLIDTIRSLIGF